METKGIHWLPIAMVTLIRRCTVSDEMRIACNMNFDPQICIMGDIFSPLPETGSDTYCNVCVCVFVCGRCVR